MSSHRLPWTRCLLFTLVTWVILILLAEGALRLVGVSPPRAIDLEARYSKFTTDSDLAWVLKPGWNGFETNDVPVRVNSLGLRGPEPRDQSGESAARILFVGDSVTFGHHLREADTIPHRLELRLAQDSGREIEVINGGVPGYSTFQQAGQIRRWAPVLQPELILLGFCLNDVTERYTTIAAFGGPRYFMADVDTAADLNGFERLWLGSAIRRVLVALLRDKAGRAEAYRLQALWESPDSTEIRDAWQLVFDELDDTAAAAKALGIRLAVVIFPLAAQVSADPSIEIPQGVLIGHLRDRGVPFVDLLEGMRRAAESEPSIFLDATHFTALGSEQAAREIAAFIERDGLLSQDP